MTRWAVKKFKNLFYRALGGMYGFGRDVLTGGGYDRPPSGHAHPAHERGFDSLLYPSPL